MTFAIFALTIAVIALVIVLLVALLRAEPTLRGREVTVNTRKPDDQTIRGVVVGETQSWLLLRDASYLRGKAELPIEGPGTRIPVSNVAFVQEH